MYSDKNLATHKTISERVDAYQTAIANLREAYDIIKTAQQQLDDAFGRGGNSSDFDVLPGRSYNIEREFEDVVTKIRRKTWRILIDLSGIRKVLSVKRAEELDKKLEHDVLDEITHENVLGMLNMLAGQGKDFAAEAVKEVYEYLRPGAGGSRYKTNQDYARWRLGKKVILGYAIQHGYSSRAPFMVNRSRADTFRALDKVFYLLDGRSEAVQNSYMSPLMDAINTSPDGFGETDYFKFRACQNGNLHLEFKRLDLVEALNRVAGGGTILHD